ncbi:pyrimidine reductase family protein [Specibacter sp. NPDC057265]|uniref:pyrimidine reductase family protein n=1 Tax=Specibacter sp. NPDC057265 TaxID=3346075 RepID=UPI0036400E93
MIERLFPSPATLSGTELEAEMHAAPLSRPPDGKPWVSFNFVASIDGAASVDGRSGELGNAMDQRLFLLLRHTAQVLVVGAQTIRAEGYGGPLLSPEAQQWRLEHGLSAHPPLAIVSGSLDLDPGMEVFTRAPVQPLIFTLASAPRDRRQALSEVAEVIEIGQSQLDIGQLVHQLTGRGLNSIHCEGGPRLLGTFAEAGEVDELSLTLSPLLVGGQAGRIASSAGTCVRSMVLDRVLKAESMLFLRYVRSQRQDGAC